VALVPLTVLLAVVFPGPTKKKVAPRRVRLPVSAANVVKLKLDRFAGTVLGTTVTVSDAWRYIAIVYRCGVEPLGGVGLI